MTEKYLVMGSYKFGVNGALLLDDLGSILDPSAESDDSAFIFYSCNLDMEGTFLRSDAIIAISEREVNGKEASLVFKSITNADQTKESKEAYLFRGRFQEKITGREKVHLRNFDEVVEGVGVIKCWAGAGSGTTCFLIASWDPEEIPKSLEAWFELLEAPHDHDKEQKWSMIECPTMIQYLKSWEDNTQNQNYLQSWRRSKKEQWRCKKL